MGLCGRWVTLEEGEGGMMSSPRRTRASQPVRTHDEGLRRSDLRQRRVHQRDGRRRGGMVRMVKREARSVQYSSRRNVYVRTLSSAPPSRGLFPRSPRDILARERRNSVPFSQPFCLEDGDPLGD